MYTCTKTYRDIPFAHRQHGHKGHCKNVHGHNWAFTFEFGCEELDENGFIYDFGKLKFIRDWLDDNFDHAFVYNQSDTDARSMILDYPQLFKPYQVKSCSTEGLAHHLYEIFAPEIKKLTVDRVKILSIEVFEDSKNSAKYIHKHPHSGKYTPWF